MAITTCPLETAAVKLFLRVDHSDEDTLIEQLMLAATEFCENFQKRTYITRTRYEYLDKFSLIIRPTYSPLVAVTSIQYYDTGGVLQTLDSAYYRVDTANEPGRITEAYNYSWPSIRNITNAVTVTYTSGYGATGDNVPDDIKTLIKQVIHYLWHRNGDIEELKKAKNMLWMRRIVNV